MAPRSKSKFYRSTFAGSQRNLTRRRTVRHFSNSATSVARTNRAFSKRKSSWQGIMKVIKFTFLGGFILGWLSLPVYLPYFRITNIIYEGFTKIGLQKTAEQVVTETLTPNHAWWPQNSFFIASTKTISERLQQDPVVRSLAVTKKFPNTLKISVVEKTGQILYSKDGNDLYVVDEGGAVVENLITSTSGISFNNPSASSSPSVTSSSQGLVVPSVTLTADSLTVLQKKPLIRDLPLIIDRRLDSPEAVPGATIIPKELLGATLEWFDASKRGLAFGPIKQILIDGETDSNRLVITTSKPWKIVTTIGRPVQDQLQTITTLLVHDTPVQYIDTSYEGRLYWK